MWLALTFGSAGIIMLIWRVKILWRVCAICLLMISCGIFRYQMSIPHNNNSSVQHFNNQKASFIALITTEPDTRKDHVKLAVEIKKGLDNIPAAVQGKVLINATLYPEHHYGDLLQIDCRLQAPEPIKDEESGRIFNYDKYLARYDIYSICYRPGIKLLAADQGNILLAALLSVKNKFVQSIQLSLPEPQASFLGGLVLGAKRAIPDDLMESFARTGTTHIVALSGYNITIIAVLISNLCKHLWISRKKAFWVSAAAIAFFVLITGAQASVVRAGIMGMLVLLATQMGRLSRITNVLILAAVIMLLVNPKVLVFDAGFQLSFLATVGLVYVSPIVKRFFNWLPDFFQIRENLVATLSATLMTLPLIIFQFGRLSLVAPLVNVLILPAIPIAMGFGFVMGLLALIWLPLGPVFGWIVWSILSYIIFIVNSFAKLNFVAFEFGQVRWLWLALGYGFLTLILFKARKSEASMIKV